jgi:hypothetical protein
MTDYSENRTKRVQRIRAKCKVLLLLKQVEHRVICYNNNNYYYIKRFYFYDSIS